MPLFSERLCGSIRRVYAQLRNSQKIYASIAIALLLMTASPVHSEGNPIDLAKQGASTELRFELRTDTPHAILPVDNAPKIVPGESVVNREARLKAEADAAAVALAKAKQKAALKQTETVSTVSDPVSFDGLYQAAGSAYGVDPSLLKAIHIVETGASGSTSRSNPSGATGPMQFLPSTFRAHAVDGNGDGVKSVYNVTDAIYTAAKYLVDCGYPNVKQALWGYNPSSSYFARVMSLARSFGMQ